MINSEIRKQLCMEKFGQSDALEIAVLRGAGEVMHRKVGGGVQKIGRRKLFLGQPTHVGHRAHDTVLI